MGAAARVMQPRPAGHRDVDTLRNGLSPTGSGRPGNPRSGRPRPDEPQRGDHVGRGEGPTWAGVALGISLLATLICLDVLLGDRVSLSGAYGTAAVAAAALTSPRRTALVAVAAVVAAGVSSSWNDLTTTDWAIRLALTSLLAGLALVSATLRVRGERQLQHMTVVAETAQRAVLRAMPSAIGSIGFAARYISATEEALIGGDLYEVASSPYGVRVIVGDARGRGWTPCRWPRPSSGRSAGRRSPNRR